jgi:hypothetical protein
MENYTIDLHRNVKKMTVDKQYTIGMYSAVKNAGITPGAGIISDI